MVLEVVIRTSCLLQAKDPGEFSEDGQVENSATQVIRKKLGWTFFCLLFHTSADERVCPKEESSVSLSPQIQQLMSSGNAFSYLNIPGPRKIDLEGKQHNSPSFWLPTFMWGHITWCQRHWIKVPQKQHSKAEHTVIGYESCFPNLTLTGNDLQWWSWFREWEGYWEIIDK